MRTPAAEPPVMPRWAVANRLNLDRTVHTWPVLDGVHHEFRAACICGPSIVHHLNGNRRVVHHSLDGRELTEPDNAELR